MSHEFGSIVEFSLDVEVIQCFDRPVKTSCGCVNVAKNAEKAHCNFFCSLNYKYSRVFRGLEQLSSLFWRGVTARYKLGAIHPRFPFVGVEILTTFWFLWHNFGSRYARKAIESSKDWDDSLVLHKILNEKIDSWDWRPGPRKVGQKNANTPHTCDVSPREPQTQSKIFFFF